MHLGHGVPDAPRWYVTTPWLSGDHIIEQAVHGIDTMGWAMGDKLPVRCWGVGGRQSRTDPKYGNIYDHFSVVYEYPNNVRGYHHCRHWVRTRLLKLKDYILGSQGVGGRLRQFRFQARTSGGIASPLPKTRACTRSRHNEMFAAIRAGKPINNGEAAAQSTLLALMGRTAAYTGQVITPDRILNAKEDLSPPRYEFGPLAMPPVPVPGTTKFVCLHRRRICCVPEASPVDEYVQTPGLTSDERPRRGQVSEWNRETRTAGFLRRRVCRREYVCLSVSKAEDRDWTELLLPSEVDGGVAGPTALATMISPRAALSTSRACEAAICANEKFLGSRLDDGRDRPRAGPAGQVAPRERRDVVAPRLAIARPVQEQAAGISQPRRRRSVDLVEP